MAQYACNNISIEAQTHGDPSHPCLVLIMGLGMQLVAWPEGFCQQLVDQGFYVVRYDNRDIGLSTEFTNAKKINLPWLVAKSMLGLKLTTPYSLSDHAADAVALLDRLNIRQAHIVGASMGGMIAQVLAIEHPSRIKSLTSIMSTTGSKQLPGPTFAARTALVKPMPKNASPKTDDGLEMLIDQYVNTLAIIGSPKYLARTADEKQAVRNRLRASFKRSFRPRSVGRQLAAIIAAPDRTKNLRLVKTPTLVIHGKKDPLIPAACGIATAAAIPSAKYLELAEMGHDLPEALWATITEAIVQHARASGSQN